MKHRWAATAVLAAVFGVGACLPSGAAAASGTFHVLQCGDYHLQSDLHTISTIGNEFTTSDQCEGANKRLTVSNSNATLKNHGGQFQYLAPGGERIVGVEFDSYLRSDNGIKAEVDAFSNQTGFQPLAWGGGPNANWEHHAVGYGGINAQAIVVRLYCDDAKCAASDKAHTWARNFNLLIEDQGDPQLGGLEGSLLGDSWIRGNATFSAQASDGGSGIRGLGTYVNGQLVSEQAGSCPYEIGWPYGFRWAVCPGQRSTGAQTLNTRVGAFHNGENKVTFFTGDFAANSATWSKTIRVDNEAPAAAFATSQDPNDPELIRAGVSDKFSGLAATKILYRRLGAVDWRPLESKLADGQLTARVNSLAEPAGVYEFMVDARDVAGNVTQTQLRQDGQPMRLEFPLKAATRLSAVLRPSGARRQTIRYGRRAIVDGQLTDAHGDPLAHRRLEVVEEFNDGAVPPTRSSSVATDAQGHWEAALRPGPSRMVSVRYPGSASHAPTAASAGQLRVKTGISLRGKRRVREGRKLRLKGRVKHLGARIPAGGKAVEIQVKYGPRTWDTVKEALYTKPNGRFKFRYRFSKVLDRNTRFKFRAKVAKEAGWAYRAPAKSKTRRVLLIAR